MNRNARRDHPRRPRVVLLSPVPPPMHGAAYATELLVQSSFAREVELVHINAVFVDDIRELQKFTPKKVARLVRYWYALVRAIILRRKTAVILTPAFYPKPFLKDAVYIWTARLLGARVVAWYHMNFAAMQYEDLPPSMQLFIRATLRAVDRHVCVGQRLVEALPGWIDRRNVAVVYNGIPAVDCAGEPERRSGRVRIVYLSNLGTAKGWRMLFEAAVRLCRRYPSLDVYFYGNPMADSPPEEIARTFGASPFPERIAYRGPVYGADKAHALCEADIFCFPSLNEAFPLTVLEAMSAGLPIVATDVGAVCEAVAHGRGGMVVPSGDVDALERALAELVDDGEQRREMGQFNRERFGRQFTVEAYAQRWCALAEHL